MPHAGLMDERALGPVEGPLQRAKLHIRGGKRRLRQGKTAAGIAALADALSGALEWYLAVQGMLHGSEAPDGDGAAYALLVNKGVLDGKFDFAAFDRITERALREDLDGFDHRETLKGLESVMTQLGVMPFEEADLPPEDPSTF